MAKPMLMTKKNQTAKVFFMANNFRMLSAGDHVLCAVTGEPIALEDLRYWSVVTQEAYASADVATRALLPKR
jgi:hypothetical protein